MELNISELERNPQTLTPYENFDYNTYQQNGYNYWETPPQPSTNIEYKEEPKKKKVTFNDILSNMNVVVNKQGILQFVNHKTHAHSYNQNENQDTVQNDSKPYYDKQQYQQTDLRNKIQKQKTVEVMKQPSHNSNPQTHEPVDPALKHSYIYNKYFSDYLDQNVNSAPQIRVPKTKEEYFQMLLDDKRRAEKKRRYIEHIKPKKMLFSSGQHPSIRPQPIQASTNNLRMMNFR